MWQFGLTGIGAKKRELILTGLRFLFLDGVEYARCAICILIALQTLLKTDERSNSNIGKRLEAAV